MTNWWDYDPEGLQEKLALLGGKDRKTPKQISEMYSHGKSGVVPEVKEVVQSQIRMEL